ncbi:MAG: hypothetical protein R3C20_19925 [Planctomycetaceae bacterium]
MDRYLGMPGRAIMMEVHINLQGSLDYHSIAGYLNSNLPDLYAALDFDLSHIHSKAIINRSEISVTAVRQDDVRPEISTAIAVDYVLPWELFVACNDHRETGATARTVRGELDGNVLVLRPFILPDDNSAERWLL